MQTVSPPSETVASVPPGRPHRRRTWRRELLEVLLIALVLYGLIWVCLQTVKVDGRSMVNTLQNGDFLIASKISYYLGSPERGDIVILNPPLDCAPGTSAGTCNSTGQAAPQTDYVKRVIGLPGDNLEIDGSQHPTALLIQPGGAGPWQKAAEPYLPDDWTQTAFCCKPDGTMRTDRAAVLQIPAGQYFVLGDNRNESSDSRFFGLVSKDRILAKAVLRIWPLDHLGGLGPGPTLVTTPAAAGLLLLGFRRRRRHLRRLAASAC